MTARAIAPVVRKRHLDEVDEDAERRAYWVGRTIEERILEVEQIRRMWIEQTGDPDAPMARVVQRRKLR